MIIKCHNYNIQDFSKINISIYALANNNIIWIFSRVISFANNIITFDITKTL